MLRTLWLTFAQAITVGLAALFILATLRPEWLPERLSRGPREAPSQPAAVPAPADAAVASDAAILSYGQAAQRATPAVVNIFTTKTMRVPRDHPLLNDPMFRRFFGEQFSQRQQTSSLGSGVIVSPDGLVLTNHHVVESADEIEVLLSDGRRATARLVGSDPETDLAVLRVSLTGLPALAFGNPEGSRIGDVVLAIGNPFGVGQTVTMGIISALGRNQLGINTFENFIQTDAAINPGNSGGALVDTSGRLLGINTAIYSRTGGSLGIGFAIPVSTARQVMDQIVATGSVTRGYIGVEPQDVTPELAEAFKLPRKDGAIIAGVMRGGPADKAGVKVGDILIAVDGKPVTNTATMLDRVAQLRPDSTARFSFVRDGREQEISITVGTRPKPGPRNGPPR
jgi:serine protease DegQ